MHSFIHWKRRWITSAPHIQCNNLIQEEMRMNRSMYTFQNQKVLHWRGTAEVTWQGRRPSVNAQGLVYYPRINNAIVPNNYILASTIVLVIAEHDKTDRKLIPRYPSLIIYTTCSHLYAAIEITFIEEPLSYQDLFEMVLEYKNLVFNILRNMISSKNLGVYNFFLPRNNEKTFVWQKKSNH